MKNLSVIFLLFISSLSFGQSNTYPDGKSTTTLSNYYGGIKVNTFFQMPRKFSDFVGSDSTGMIWFDSALTKTVMYNDGHSKQTLTSKHYVDSIAATSIGGVTQTTLNDSCASIRASIGGADSTIFVTVTRQKDSLANYLPTWLFTIDTQAQRNYSNALYQPIGAYLHPSDTISLSNRLADSIALVVHKKDSLIAGGYTPFSAVNYSGHAGQYLGSNVSGTGFAYYTPPTVVGTLSSTGNTILLNPSSGYGSVVDVEVNPASAYKFTGRDTFTQTVTFQADISASGHNATADTFKGKVSQSNIYPSPTTGTVTSVAAGTNLLGGTITTTGTLTPDTSSGHLATKTDLTSYYTKTISDGRFAPISVNGTVTSASVVSANGFSGSVATATTTPAITISTSINSPILAGNGTAISGATTTGSGSTACLATHPTVSSPIVSDSLMILANGVSAMTGIVHTLIDHEGTLNNYLQANLRNQSNGASASGDYVVTADNGSETTHYIDMGINGSGFSASGTWTVNGADGAYLYSQSDTLAIGTAAAKPILFFTGGTLASNVAMTISGTGNATLASAGTTAGSIATIDGTQTITNKRWQPRATTTTTVSATPSINTDNVDEWDVTAQAVNITSMTTNLTGTPVNGQMLVIQLTATGSLTLSWGSSFESATNFTLPTTMSTTLEGIVLKWNPATSKWRCVGLY